MDKQKSRNTQGKKTGAALISSALLGLDFRVVIVNGKRYIIEPPTIAKIAGASYFLSDIASAESVMDMLGKSNILDATAALSYFICGTDKLKDELTKGTLKEIVEALAQAYSLIDLSDFSMLSTLARNVSTLTAKAKQ